MFVCGRGATIGRMGVLLWLGALLLVLWLVSFSITAARKGGDKELGE